MKKVVSVLLWLMIAITLMFNSTVQAAFVSVEDFESYNLGDVAGYDIGGTPIAGSPNPTSPWRTNVSTTYNYGQYTVVSDMSGGSPKVLLAGAKDWSSHLTLPSMPDIANNTTATVYFRIKPLNTSTGAWYDRRLGPSGPPWNPPQMKSPTTGVYLNSGNFKPQDSTQSVSFENTSCWWSFWVVVNNTANTYTLYYQREDGGSQTQLAANRPFSFDLANSSSPLTDFYLYHWTGSACYLDDIYIDTASINLSTPQIPTRVGSMAGSESPTVHSPGDAITVTVKFPKPVTLSQAGGAKLQLNIAGTLVDAVQAGSLTGTSLTFKAAAPSITTMSAKVVANGLQLLNGATLRDSASVNVILNHVEVPLPNDQISVERLSVYPPVQGLTPSPRFSFRVHEVGSTQWMTPFAWFTRCIDRGTGVPNNQYMNAFIGGWSNTYCNFEMANNVPVEVEITRLDFSTGLPVAIQKATPHPRRKVRSWRIENGKVYVIFDKPVLFAVDVDGQLDEHIAPRIVPDDWGDGNFPYVNEKAFHGVTIFANPFILDKPVLGAPGVLAVEPGQIPPDDGSWTTLYFKPGVHKLFPGERWDKGDEFWDFRLRGNRKYYIPGDAIVYGNMNNMNISDSFKGQNIRVFGHGTLSGEKITHALAMVPELIDRPRTRALRIDGAKGCRVEGITFTDPADHTCALVGGYNTDPALFNYVRWAKSIGWRANSDGITPNGSGYVEDCFLRTQDDGSYIQGLGIRRVVYWHDANGMSFRCDFVGSERGSNFPASLPQQMIIEDCDVIYGRNFLWTMTGRSIIGSLGTGGSNNGSYVVFKNLNYEDPLPIRKLIGWDISGGSHDMAGIRFENVRAAARPCFDNPPAYNDPAVVMYGDPNAHLRNLIINNVSVAGAHYDSMDDFTHNQYAHDFVFQNTAPETMTYLNTSGYGKWYVYGDWDRGTEPLNNDIVNHTVIASVLTVDAQAYAGSLNIAHADTATVSIELDGDLTVANGISIGALGRGELDLLDGFLELKNSAGSALSVVNGEFHIEKGTLFWAGNHISDIQALYAAGKLTVARGQEVMLSPSATLIGQYGQSKLYADYNSATVGYTTVWVARLSGQTVSLQVEAENYATMSGIQKENTSDTGGGQNIGYTENGDWAQYLINIPAAGTYQVEFRVASATSGGTINMVVGGSTIGTAAVTGTGGWQTWKTVTTTATFSTAGVQTLRLNFVGGSGYLYNINWFKCTITILLQAGDFNGDNKVNLVDFELLSSDWQNGYEMMDLLDMAENWLLSRM